MGKEVKQVAAILKAINVEGDIEEAKQEIRLVVALANGNCVIGVLSALTVLSLVGCVSGGGSTSQVEAAPSIASQPANQSVPMGLTGTFTVQADGPDLQYQWSRNGSIVLGATSTTLTTPATAFSDTGAVFTVAITNPWGSITSSPASLTVTARAPTPGDLRFQQVDAVSTINGYTIDSSGSGTVVGCPAPGGGGSSLSFPSATGTSFFLGNNTCSDQFTPFVLPVGVSGLEIAYSGVPMQNYQSILNAPPSYFGFPGPSDLGSVITSLSLLPTFNAAALAFIHSDTSCCFDRTQYTVPAAGLQALATQEALHGRVLTAVSYDGTQATVFSYGWTGDPSSVYEAEVVFGTLDSVTAQAQTLAANGYIITATGCTQAADGSGVILIGTRVQGDTMARPFLVGNVLTGSVDALFAQGYAVVAVVNEWRNNNLILKNYLGER